MSVAAFGELHGNLTLPELDERINVHLNLKQRKRRQ
jgi:hypothetical protein